jgi:DNA-binding NtrC family response regulator
MGKKILVIDDELDMLMLLRMIIENNTDYAVETTNNPSEALKLAADRPFDLVISDLKMPGIDGLELFDEMKKIRPEMPVIIITAYGSPDTASEAMRAGIADFITKPFRKDRILFTIQRVLDFAQMKQAYEALKKKVDPAD